MVTYKNTYRTLPQQPAAYEIMEAQAEKRYARQGKIRDAKYIMKGAVKKFTKTVLLMTLVTAALMVCRIYGLF